jgi:hypothetical protein
MQSTTLFFSDLCDQNVLDFLQSFWINPLPSGGGANREALGEID